jgi:hypothetical protein
MNYRVVPNREGAAFTRHRQKKFLPHLVCSWTLDPVSHRLSCAWAAPAERRGIALWSPRIAASMSRRDLMLATARG